MACPGSANLEQAIPGYVEPIRDDMAGAKGIGTILHDNMQIFSTMTPISLWTLAECLDNYAKLHYKIRREIVATESDLDTWIWNQTHRVLDEQPELVSPIKSFFAGIAGAQHPPSMLTFLALAAEYMGNLIGDLHAYPEDIRAEAPLTATWLAGESGTTPDVVILGDEELHVVDYKTGRIPVTVEDNDQLLFYAASAMQEYYSVATRPDTIVVHIVQPGNMASWTFDREYLEKWMRKAYDAEQRILNGDLSLRPSDHCTFCPANPHTRGDKATVKCPAMMEILYPPSYDEDEIFAL